MVWVKDKVRGENRMKQIKIVSIFKILCLLFLIGSLIYSIGLNFSFHKSNTELQKKLDNLTIELQEKERELEIYKVYEKQSMLNSLEEIQKYFNVNDLTVIPYDIEDLSSFYDEFKLEDSDLYFEGDILYANVKGKPLMLLYFSSDNAYYFCEVFDVLDKENKSIFRSIFYDFLNSLPADTIEDMFYKDERVTIEKPVIYLYPEKEISVEVKLENIDFTATYPLYENGWRVTARPDGTLCDKEGREYNYLYWEGHSDVFVSNMDKGFVVERDNYIQFLEDKLSEIGLTDKEACDFITYWLPQMNEYEYCLASFQMENYEDQVKLDYSVNPDNELRLFVAFKGLDRLIDIEEQDLSYYEDFEREGFVVVEWGGTFVDEE